MVENIQIITFVVGAAFIYNGYRLVRSGREDITLFLMSGVIGIGLMTVAAVPNIFEIIGTALGLEWKGRAILVVANLTLFVIITYLVNQIGRLHDHISKLNEEVSLLRNAVEEADNGYGEDED